MFANEIFRSELFQIEQLVALGLGRYEAIEAVEAGVDWRTVASRLTEQDGPIAVTPALAS
jgi:hypothetical protein